MSGMKSLLIETLRGSSESDVEWTLRKNFLHRNMDANANTQYKDYIINLSHSFIQIALYRSQEYSYNVTQDIYLRSRNMIDSINRAQYEMRNAQASSGSAQTFSQAKQNDYSASTSTFTADTNSLCVIPTQKDIVGKKRAKRLRRQQRKYDLKCQQAAMLQQKPETPMLRPNPTVQQPPARHQKPVSNLPPKSLFSSFVKGATLLPNREKQSSDKQLNQTETPLKKDPASNTDQNTNGSECSSDTYEAQKDSTKGDEEDLISDDMMKLTPVMVMADYYLEMDNDESENPFITLKKCAAGSKQKLRFQSKKVTSKTGSKLFACQVYISDTICLQTVYVPIRSCPEQARKKLAQSTLKKICLPYLRLTPGENDVVLLEGSRAPFEEEEDVEKESCSTDPVDSSSAKSLDDDIKKETLDSNEWPSDQPQSTHIEKPIGFSGNGSGSQQTSECNASSSSRIDPDHIEFDSYIAWSTETHPALKKIRQLGHLYQTLPYKVEDLSVVVKLLSNVSDIQLSALASKDPSNPNNFTCSIAMDSEILLASSKAGSEQRAVHVASLDALNKVSLPYLRLESNRLESSSTPFPDLTDEERKTKQIVQDNYLLTATQKAENKDLDPPLRLSRFYIIRGHVNNYHHILLTSARKLKKKMSFTYNRPTKDDGLERFSFVNLEGHALAKCFTSGKKTSRKAASEEAFWHLRKCHWVMYEEKLVMDKYSTVEELEESLQHCNTNTLDTPQEDFDYHLPSTQVPGTVNVNHLLKNSALDSSNMGHKLLTKMGWSGGGIGKNGTGISEPVSVQMVVNKAGLGFNRTSSGSQRTGGSKNTNNTESDSTSIFAGKDICIILQAYAQSKIQKALLLPTSYVPEFGRIRDIAPAFGMVPRRKGTKGQKKIIVQKCSEMEDLFQQVVSAGGTSDKYQLLPPEIITGSGVPKKSSTRPGQESAKTASKCVQCCLIEAPPLQMLSPGVKADITYDYDFSLAVADNEEENNEKESDVDSEAEPAISEEDGDEEEASYEEHQHVDKKRKLGL